MYYISYISYSYLHSQSSIIFKLIQIIFISAYFFKQLRYYKQLYDITVIATFCTHKFCQIFIFLKEIETCWYFFYLMPLYDF